MNEPIQFVVYGTAKSAGSKRAFIYKSKKTGKQMAAITDDCAKSQDWKGSVMAAASVAYDGPLLSGPLFVTMTFYFQRPKGDYGAGRNSGKLKPSAPKHKTTLPDVTKIVRGTEDALKDIIWGDDAQVVEQKNRKTFCKLGERPRAEITVIEL